VIIDSGYLAHPPSVSKKDMTDKKLGNFGVRRQKILKFKKG
jgi:hypothetical protein